MEKEWHLVECADTESLLPIIDCICEPLRRCEQRMIEDRSDSMWKAGYHEGVGFVLRLADLPRPVGEQHEMDPPHQLCLGDDPCICIHLAACEEVVLRNVTAAIEYEQRTRPDTTSVRIGLGIAKSAVNKLMREQA